MDSWRVRRLAVLLVTALAGVLLVVAVRAMRTGRAYDVERETRLRTENHEAHKAAQKTKSQAGYRRVRLMYESYLAEFATSTDEREVADSAFNERFYYAEVLWALDEWEQAAKQYEWVVGFKVPERPEAVAVTNFKYLSAAAYNRILSYDKLVKRERAEHPNRPRRRAPTYFEQQLVKACDDYNARFPGNSDAFGVELTSVDALANTSQTIEAARRAMSAAQRYSSRDEAAKAADLALQIFQYEKAWGDLWSAARAVQSNEALAPRGSLLASLAADAAATAQKHLSPPARSAR